MQLIRLTIAILGVLLVPFRAFPTVQFSHSVVEPQQVWDGHKPKVIGDFDLSGSPGIGIYFANDGFKLYKYPAFVPFLITSFQNGIADEDAEVADVNGDGAPDIVVGGKPSGNYWLENPLRQGKDPYASAWTVHRIDSTHSSHDLVVRDINRDGKIDIATERGIYLQGNTPDRWTFVGVANIHRGFQGTSLADLTGDGYLDIVAPDTTGSHLSWFENPLHQGGDPVAGNWTEHVIDSSPGFVGEMTSSTLDVNQDGRLDVVMTPMYSDGNLSWYAAPQDPRNSPWVKHVIGPAQYVHQGSLQVADFDGDGLLDIAFAEQEQSSMKRIGIFFNGGSGLSWPLQVLATTGGHNLKAGRIGPDRYPSLLCANHGFYGAPTSVELWRNLTVGSGPPPPAPVPTPSAPTPPPPGRPVSDEFNGPSLDTGLWTFENPLGDGTVRLNGSGVEISVPAGVVHDLWTPADNAARLVQKVANADFAAEIKFDSVPSLRFQMQGIVVEQDNSNYLRFETYHDGSSLHLFVATSISDRPFVRANSLISAPGPSIWLRMIRTGDAWNLQWSTDGITFAPGASFNYPMTVTRIGPHIGNNYDSTGRPPSATALVDYFRSLN